MKYAKSFLSVMAVMASLSAVMTPAHAIYNSYGDLIMVIYYPDGSVVL